MSKRWPGGIVTKNQATPTGNFEDSSAPGIWTLSQVAYWVKQALWPTPGVLNPGRFIENIFSTYLYTGNGTSQTITNGINLSGQGGLTWVKSRSASTDNFLFDTSRGALNEINSNTTDVQASLAASLTAFNTNGFNLGSAAGINVNAATYVSWTFRKQPKLFDIVTYSGDGVPGRQIAHNLGSAPGCIIVKNTNVARDWAVWHRTLADGTYLKLNTTDSVITNTSFQVFGDASGQTSSVFTVGKTGSGVNGLTNANASSETYVAYLFAHNAGGFGLTGNDNVISCGSYTGTGANPGPIINLGYEPQWVMIKSFGTGYWEMYDNMRGLPAANAAAPDLSANAAFAENSLFGGGQTINALSTGFQINTTATDTNAGGQTYLYIAIRRGPMQVPTTGTSVFSPLYRQGNGIQTALSAGFAPDSAWTGQVSNNGSAYRSVVDRLRGVNVSGTGTGLLTQSTQNEAGSYTSEYVSFDQNGMTVSTGPNQLGNASSAFFLSYYFFKRAPGFFDTVCYTGTGLVWNIPHNLGVVPELIIYKSRSNAVNWGVSIFATTPFLGAVLNTISAAYNASSYPAPNSSTFSSQSVDNNPAVTYVAYLFATVAGVSKVGSYTGNGSNQTINCSFTTGARFIMIKRTDSTGDWYVWDTARGIVAGNDPHSSLNTTAAQVTTDDSVDADNSGFIVNQLAATNINVNAASYIFLAIA